MRTGGRAVPASSTSDCDWTLEVRNVVYRFLAAAGRGDPRSGYTTTSVAGALGAVISCVHFLISGEREVNRIWV
jgi:hypothetical protein